MTMIQRLNRRGSFMLAIVCAMIAIALAARAANGPIAFPTGEVAVVTGEGERHAFTVEIARTSDQHARGLMYRRELAKDHGMLFLYDQVRPVTMWMKNTYIPLDMLFVSPSGRITRVRERTVPESTTPIPSGGPVKAVLELRGGTVDRLGIETGDTVAHAAFGGS
jgi:uncharacterized membrane protein (UPF0127 family)